MNPKREKRLQEAAQAILSQRTGHHVPPVKASDADAWECPKTGERVSGAEVYAHAFPEGEPSPAYDEFRDDGSAS